MKKRRKEEVAFYLKESFWEGEHKVKWAQASAGETAFGHNAKHLLHEGTEVLGEKPREDKNVFIFRNNQNSLE